VLQFIVTEALFLGYPDAPEGQMTRARASVVSGSIWPEGGQPGRGD
jgi:dsRNA-specific ribonuclease